MTLSTGDRRKRQTEPVAGNYLREWPSQTGSSVSHGDQRDPSGTGNRIAVGDVVQIDPAHDPGKFGGCFLVVTELKSFGVQGYVTPLPNDGGLAYYRVAFDKIVRVGVAEWRVE